MRYAVYGTGSFRDYAGSIMSSLSPDNMQFLFIDGGSSAIPAEGPVVIDLNTFEKQWMNSVDAVLICSKDYKVRQEMVKAMLRTGFGAVYVADNYVLSGRLPLFHEDGSFCSYVRKLEDVKPVLSYIEFHVTDCCNLKCKNCGHHANEVKEMAFASLTVFEEALAGLAGKFENVDVFRLMGGEPLLAPNIHQYAELVLKYFPSARSRLQPTVCWFPE